VPHYGSKVRASVATGDALRSEMASISCRVGPLPETNPDCWMKGLLSPGILRGCGGAGGAFVLSAINGRKRVSGVTSGSPARNQTTSCFHRTGPSSIG